MESNFFKKDEHSCTIIDSRHGTSLNGSLNSNIKFNFNQPILQRNKYVLHVKCSVLNFTCPNAFYNINSYNNILIITFNNITYTYTFTKGNYNANNFMTLFLSTVDATFRISFNSITNIYTITNTTYNFTITSNSTCGDVMGFINGSSYTSTNKILTLPYECNFNGIPSINIHLKNMKTLNIDSKSKTTNDIILSLPINAFSSQIIYIKNNEYGFDIDDEISIQDLTVLITDDNNNFIDFNSKNWNMTLLFEIKRIEIINFD